MLVLILLLVFVLVLTLILIPLLILMLASSVLERTAGLASPATRAHASFAESPEPNGRIRLTLCCLCMHVHTRSFMNMERGTKSEGKHLRVCILCV